MSSLNREKIENDLKTLCSYVTTQEKEIENAKFQISALELFLELNSTKYIYIPQCIFSEQIKFQQNYFQFGSLKQIICEITKKNGKAYFTSNDSFMKSYFNSNELQMIMDNFSILEGSSIRFEATCETISASQLLPTSILNFPTSTTVIEEIQTEKIELPIPSSTVISEPITISIPESQLLSVNSNDNINIPVETVINVPESVINVPENIQPVINLPENTQPVINVPENTQPIINILENNAINIPENIETNSKTEINIPENNTNMTTETIIITIPNNILIDDQIEVEEPKNIDTLSCTSLEDMAGEITAELK